MSKKQNVIFAQEGGISRDKKFEGMSNLKGNNDKLQKKIHT
jgi:hypothetical protein